jgi:hypothetical protein
MKVNGRPPGEPEALATTSNRTKPHEGHYISAMDGRAKRRQQQKLKSAPMKNPEQLGWLEQRGFWWTGLGQSETFRYRSRPSRQSARRLRDRTFGLRVEEVPRTNATLRLDSFCDRDQPGRGRRAVIGRRDAEPK